MANLSGLPHLLKLLDDESPEIRETVFKELRGFGPVLEERLAGLKHPLDDYQKRLLKPVLEATRRSWLKHEWPSLLDIHDEYEQLELAHHLIACFQFGKTYPYQLKTLLNQLAEEFCSTRQSKDVLQLARFLFTVKKLNGVENDYYNPKNSNLVSVILNKRGIPISLAIIYMLVGRRVGLTIEGCNFPGHFLARIRVRNKVYLVDCFNDGQVISEDEIAQITPVTSNHLSKILNLIPSAPAIIERVVRNLVRAYQLKSDSVNSNLMIELLNLMKKPSSLNTSEDLDMTGVTQPLFKPGQLVNHKHYGYRGVVVDFDTTCQADKLWYESNQTQPDRCQPWYHILVHQATHTTYAAQTNLLPDESGKEIDHPLVPYFFMGFQDGHYIRNSEPWWKDTS